MFFQELLNSDYKLYSFDIFDTVIMRKCGTPKGIFYEMQIELLKSSSGINKCLLNNFCDRRVKAEQIARINSSKEEISLYEIYEILQRDYDLNLEEVKYLINLEIDKEMNNAIANTEITLLINELRKKGKKVIFTSDMYLPKNVIIDILKKNEIFKDGDVIYLSSELNKTKEKGSLFYEILKLENCKKEEIVHIGDNIHSDFNVPKSIGIKSYLYDKTKFSRYEKIVYEDNYCFNKIVGAFKVLRINSINVANSDTYNVGVIAGFILLGYVLWILYEANRLKLKNLFFLSRDGQILFEIANKVNKFTKYDINFKYIYASRQAWHLPSIYEKITEREIDWILEKDPIVNFNIIAARLSLDPYLLMEKVNKEQYVTDDIYENLSNEKILKLRNVLLHSKIVQEMIFDAANSKRINAISYFNQEGLLDSKDIGIVDLGWKGRLQDSLKRILEIYKKNKKIYGFYFGLTSLGEISNTNEKYSYLFDPNNIKYKKIGEKAANIMEIFTTANHGSTIEYVDNGGFYFPKLRNDFTEEKINFKLNVFRSGIFDFLDLVLDNHIISEIMKNNDNYKTKTVKLLKIFIDVPNFYEAKVIGSYKFSSDQAEKNYRMFAQPLSLKDFIKYNYYYRDIRKVEITYWYEGSIIQSKLYIKYFNKIHIDKLIRLLGLINKIIHFAIKRGRMLVNYKKFL
ncbi:HAD family hydrolase [Thermoanaerobacterium thermosaccharolyticum]|uniref:HAD family hydrolase n=1 Tax=Thermoanaerobacterium thermosaccharolyticum TaxID=1517 RepID=UPI003DA95C7B